MRVAYFECFSGISGDMLLGALLDSGVSEELLCKTVAALNIGAELHFTRVDRSGISSTKVDVVVDGGTSDGAQHHHMHDHHHADDHDLSHAHDHNQGHPHHHSNSHDA